MPGAPWRPEKRGRAGLGDRPGPFCSAWLSFLSARVLPGSGHSGEWLCAGLYPFQPTAASGICAGRGRRPPVPREPDSGGGHVHAEALPPRPCRRTPCAGPARRSRPVSTLPRAAAPVGPAGAGGVGPLGPFPARLPAAPAGGAGLPPRKAAVPRSMVLPRTLMPSERRGWRGARRRR